MTWLLRARVHLIVGIALIVWDYMGGDDAYFYALVVLVVAVAGALELVRRRADAKTLREVEASQERYHAQKEAEHRERMGKS